MSENGQNLKDCFLSYRLGAIWNPTGSQIHTHIFCRGTDEEERYHRMGLVAHTHLVQLKGQLQPNAISLSPHIFFEKVLKSNRKNHPSYWHLLVKGKTVFFCSHIFLCITSWKKNLKHVISNSKEWSWCPRQMTKPTLKPKIADYENWSIHMTAVPNSQQNWLVLIMKDHNENIYWFLGFSKSMCARSPKDLE